VAEAFTARLIEKAKAVIVGNGLKQGVTMGPAVSQQQLEGNLNYVRSLRRKAPRCSTAAGA
jgi:acyl-CoA reductase-like NAD-dependent aldehyde dehydrogenase